MNIEKCCVCGGEFYTSAIKNGKCVICNAEHPNANSLEDALRGKQPNKELMVNLTEARVRTIIYEILDEAGLSRKKCEKCQKLYFARSPAQKQCDACKLKTDEAKPEKLVIETKGNVSLACPSPTAELHINKTGNKETK